MEPAGRLDSIAEKILEWAESRSDIRAVFWFGSYAAGRAETGSDLDAAVLVQPEADIDGAVRDLRQILGSDCHLIAGGARLRKVCFWTGASLAKVDLVLARDPEELAWLADAEDVPSPRLVFAFARDEAAAAALIERAERSLHVDAASRVNDEIEKFLLGCEACSAAHHRGDAYGFCFEYNLALGRLAQLVQIARRRPERLFLPAQLMDSCLDPQERQRFTELACPMDLREAEAAKTRLRVFSLTIVEELSQKLDLTRTVRELAEFCELISRRDRASNAETADHRRGKP